MLSHVQLFMTPWTVACQAPLSMGFSWQEYWNGVPFLPPGNFLTQVSNHCLLHLSPALADRFLLPLAPPGKPNYLLVVSKSIQNNYIQLLHRFLSPN